MNKSDKQIEKYRELKAELQKLEDSYREVKFFTLKAIAREIKGFHDLLEKFTRLHEEILRDTLVAEKADPEMFKFQQAIQSGIDKIQFIYLIRLTLMEGRRLNFYNVIIAVSAIFIGLLCTIFSLWWSKKDAEPGAYRMLNVLTSDSLAIRQVIIKDSMIIKDLRQIKRLDSMAFKHSVRSPSGKLTNK